jgi:hypothetical protein
MAATEIKCTSSFTISDYYDAVTLSGYIGSNHPHTQVYTAGGGYVPDWSQTNLVLTPQLFRSSVSNDIISEATRVTWYRSIEDPLTVISSTAGQYQLSGSKNHILTVKRNIGADKTNEKFICVIEYHDTVTGLDLIHKMDITFTRVNSGAGTADALCIAENGNVFRNSQSEYLIATCDLYRGSDIDNTLVSYQWYIMSPQDPNAVDGWIRLTNTSGMYEGVTTHQLKVYAAAVPNLSVFKCVITDLDEVSDTYMGSFYDTITFIDLSDPIQCGITSTGGDTFKNGIGHSELVARLF